MAVACTDYQVDIDDLNNRVDELENTKIANISQQITSINASIPVLQSTSSELKTMINSLKTTVEGYDAAIAKNEEGLAQLKSDIEKSIEELRKSIEEDKSADKQEMLDALNAAKAEIEAQIAALQTDTQNKLDQMNEVLSDLQEKDASIEGRIDSLKIFVNEELTSQKDWATKTFATLEQQKAIQSDITAIKSDISTLQSSLTALEDRITREYTKAINSATASLKSEITATANQITDAYKAAIATAKKEITDAYDKAIKDAISTLETSLKGWVNEQLKGYYTTAQIKAKIDSLHTVIDGELATQQAYIDALEAVLGDTEEITKNNETIVGLINKNADNFTELYNALTKKKSEMKLDELAIVSAMLKDGGAISEFVNKEIKDYVDGLEDTENWITDRFEAIEKDVKTLEGEVDALQEEVSTLSDKLNNFINGRIQSLTVVPTSEDGELHVGIVDDLAYDDFNLKFRVTPTSLASSITLDMLSAVASYPGTDNEVRSVKVKSVDTTYGNGIIGVTLAASDVFAWSENNVDYCCDKAAVSVTVTDTKDSFYDVSSEFIYLTADRYFLSYDSADNMFSPEKFNLYDSTNGIVATAASGWTAVFSHGYKFIDIPEESVSLDLDFSNNSNIKSLAFGPLGVSDSKPVQVLLRNGEGIFKGSTNLTSVDFGRYGLDTRNITSFANMFDGCSSLVDVKMQYCNTSALTSTVDMFKGCTSLENVDLSGWDVSKVTNFTGMFAECSKLKDVKMDWSDFYGNEISVYGMFRGTAITNVDISVPKGETVEVASTGEMFRWCSALESVKLKGSVTKMGSMVFMFQDCTSLKEVDLSGWAVNNVNELRGMFSGCTNLETITLNDWNFDTTKNKINFTDMFKDCKKLKTINMVRCGENTKDVIENALKNAGLEKQVTID